MRFDPDDNGTAPGGRSVSHVSVPSPAVRPLFVLNSCPHLTTMPPSIRRAWRPCGQPNLAGFSPASSGHPAAAGAGTTGNRNGTYRTRLSHRPPRVTRDSDRLIVGRRTGR